MKSTYRKFAQSFLLCLFMLAAPIIALSGDNVSGNSHAVLDALQTMQTSFPQQKVFLHTDKEEYLVGERIWFKAYVVNAASLKPDTLSTNFNVKLTNTNGDIVTVLLLHLKSGVAHGEISLPDSLSEGNYQLRAYTDWMRNFDDTFLFTQDIYIFNPIEPNFIKRLDVFRNRLFNRRLQRQKEQFQFAFFPEGGNLVAGLTNRVAFKAANALGEGVQANGTITDGNGIEVLAFSTHHNGMGSFSFFPAHGQRYTAIVSFENGETMRIRLPEAKPAGYMLQADIEGGKVVIKVMANIDPATALLPSDVYLLAQSRSKPHLFEKVQLADRTFSTYLHLNDLPDGICQIGLFTAHGIQIAERLVFINNNDIRKASIINKTIVREDEYRRISLDLSFTKPNMHGSYSVAVVDAKTTDQDLRSNIASEFLIFSDLNYRAKDPWFYLTADDDDATKAVDLVMMTNGWRRFEIEALVAGEFPEINHGFPSGITLRGQVSPRSSDRKIGETNVELALFDQDGKVEILHTTSDADGIFVFPSIFYDGVFTAELRTDKRYERRALDLELDERMFDKSSYTANFNTRPRQIIARSDNWQRVSKPETVRPSRPFIRSGDGSQSIYGTPDQVVYFDDIRDQYASILDVLRTRVRGIRIIGGEITLRGPSSLVFTNEPLFLVDETVVNRSAFLSVNVREVDRLTVISGPQSAILGSRGANGALLIYTLRGDSHRQMTYQYIMQGFHQPTETFEAKINTDVHAQYNMDRTLYWEPNATTEEDSSIRLSFLSDKHERNLRLIIQGIDNTGRITFTDLFIDN